LGPDGLAIFNADDPFSVDMLSEVNHPALTIGIRQSAEITAEVIERYVNEQTFVLTAGDESVGVRTTIIGDHHVYNCLTAAALCLAYGIDLTTVARGLEAVQTLPGRMERVACGQDFAVFVDSAHTPDTLRACLQAARQATTGRLICVFGAFGERVLGERAAIGRVVDTLADLAVVTSNWPCGEEPRKICVEVLRGVDEPRNVKTVVDRTEAIAWALDNAREGDTVVIAGLGDRAYDELGPDGLPIDDREVITQLLRGTFAWTPPSHMAA
jgi:UDP-N-acetylmuramoyl-L-alanyl-D-glutamate--2,6-diaminopimelate ligase